MKDEKKIAYNIALFNNLSKALNLGYIARPYADVCETSDSLISIGVVDGKENWTELFVVDLNAEGTEYVLTEYIYTPATYSEPPDCYDNEVMTSPKLNEVMRTVFDKIVEDVIACVIESTPYEEEGSDEVIDWW